MRDAIVECYTEMRERFNQKGDMYNQDAGAFALYSNLDNINIIIEMVWLKILRASTSDFGSEQWVDSIRDIFGYKFCWDILGFTEVRNLQTFNAKYAKICDILNATELYAVVDCIEHNLTGLALKVMADIYGDTFESSSMLAINRLWKRNKQSYKFLEE